MLAPCMWILTLLQCDTLVKFKRVHKTAPPPPPPTPQPCKIPAKVKLVLKPSNLSMYP